MTAGITLPLAAVLGMSAKLSMEFGDAMAKVQGAAGAGAEEVKALRGEVLSLATATGKAPKELADGLYYVESMGYRGAKAMAVLTQSARLSAAGMGSTADIAKTITFAVNAYGEKNLTAARAADIFAAAVREGAMAPEALAGAIGRVLPEASRLGVGLDQLSGSLAAMTRIGLNVDEAVTAMRQTFLTLDHPSSQTKKALASVGLTAEQVSKGLHRDLIGTLGVLAKASEKGGEAFQRIFPNVRAFTGVLALTGTHSSEVAGMIDRVTNSTGAAAKIMEVASNTAGFKFRQALTSLQVAGISLGDALEPVIKTIADKVQELATAFTKLSPKAKEFAAMGALIAASVGPLLLAFGSLTRTALTMIGLFEKVGPFLARIAAAFSEAGGAAGLLGEAIEVLSGPVGWVIAAATAIYEAWVHNWGGIRDYVYGLVSEIVGWWNSELPKIQEATQTVVGWCMKIWEYLKPFLSGLWQSIIGILGFAWDTIKATLTAAWRVLSNLFDLFLNVLTGHWSEAWQNIKNIGAAIAGAIIKTILALCKGALELVQGLVNALGGLLGFDKWKGMDGSEKWLDESMHKFDDWGKSAETNAKKVTDAVKATTKAHMDAHNDARKNAEKHNGPGISTGDPLPGSEKHKKHKKSDAEKHLEEYRKKIQELMKDIALVGKTEEWEKAIVERKYGEYKQFTNAEWLHIYALEAKKGALEKSQAALEASREKEKEYVNQVNEARKAELEAIATTEKDRVAVNMFGKLFAQISDAKHRAEVLAIAASKEHAQAITKQREATARLTESIKSEIDRLREQIGMNGKATESEKMLYQVTEGAYKNAGGLVKGYLVYLAKQIEMTDKAKMSSKELAAVLIAVNPMMALSAMSVAAGMAQKSDFDKYLKTIATDMRKLTARTHEQEVSAEMWAKYWLLGSQKVQEAIKKTLDRDKLEQMQKDWQKMADKLFTIIDESLNKISTHSFKSFFSSVLAGMKDMLQQMVQQWVQAQLKMALFGQNGQSGFLGGFLSHVFGGARAVGGPVSSGKAYLVGESGPELFVPNNAGHINTASQTRGMQHSPTIVMNINTPDADSFRSSHRQIMTDTILAMHRQARRSA